MEQVCQDHSCTLNTLKSVPKIAGFIAVYLVAVCNRKFIAVSRVEIDKYGNPNGLTNYPKNCHAGHIACNNSCLIIGISVLFFLVLNRFIFNCLLYVLSVAFE